MSTADAEREAPRARGGASAFLQGTLAAGLLVAAATLAAPSVSITSVPVLGALTFAGAALIGLVGVALGARTPLAPRAAVMSAGLAAAVVTLVALARPGSRWIVVAVDPALVAFACATGASIGARVQHPGHLLPACAIAASADVLSVFSSMGPTHAIAESERALSVLAVSFPVAGTRVVAPAVGVGDLVFLALVLGAIGAHRLPYLRAAILAGAGLLAAGLAAAATERAIPALPFIAAPVIAFVPAARAIARKDRTVTTIAVGVAIVVAAWTLVKSAS